MFSVPYPLYPKNTLSCALSWLGQGSKPTFILPEASCKVLILEHEAAEVVGGEGSGVGREVLDAVSGGPEHKRVTSGP